MIQPDNNLQYRSEHLDSVFEPQLLRLTKQEDRLIFEALISENKVSLFLDVIYNQLKEFIKSRNPTIQLTESDFETYIDKHINGISLNEYGVWVYYPWNKSLVHILDEEEFIEVRTNRNREKITSSEQKILNSKVVGIVGLSVGQSIALTMAMERTCGELRLADFDTIELSNLNRLRTGLHNLGLKKTIVAAREIAEIDPFLKVKLYNDGLTSENMNSFFATKKQLDLFVEVCDNIEVKIASRVKARELKIPVVMDTNDRGMLDIERFDLEPERSLFHGLIDEFSDATGRLIVDKTNRFAILMALVAFDSLSPRMKLSMEQINKTITTWPQLASSVVLGGAITTDICRRILLKQHQASGRYYVDLDQLLN